MRGVPWPNHTASHHPEGRAHERPQHPLPRAGPGAVAHEPNLGVLHVQGPEGGESDNVVEVKVREDDRYRVNRTAAGQLLAGH